MRTRNKYYIDNQEVDVSTYSIQVSKGIPGEYKIKTEYDDIEESIVKALDEANYKIDDLECRMYSSIHYDLDKLKDKVRTLIDVLNESELSSDVRYKLNELKYEC